MFPDVGVRVEIGTFFSAIYPPSSCYWSLSFSFFNFINFPGADQLCVANYGREYSDADGRWIGVVISVTFVSPPRIAQVVRQKSKLTFISYNADSNVVANVVRFLKDPP